MPRLICFNRIPKTGSIIDIVIISNYSRLALILTALAIAGQLEAQVDLSAPESETEDQTEATPSPELPPGGPVQIRPDEGSPVAGAEVAPEFDIGRRLQISASINGGYDDNVNLTPNGSPSWYANPNANLSYQFGSARLAMDLLTGGGIIYYFDHPGGLNYDPIVSLDLSLAYKVTPRLTLDFSTTQPTKPSQSLLPRSAQLAGWEITFVRKITFPLITDCHLGCRVSPAIPLAHLSMKARRPRDTIAWNRHFRSSCDTFGSQLQPFPGRTGSVSMNLKALGGIDHSIPSRRAGAIL